MMGDGRVARGARSINIFDNTLLLFSVIVLFTEACTLFQAYACALFVYASKWKSRLILVLLVWLGGNFSGNIFPCLPFLALFSYAS